MTFQKTNWLQDILQRHRNIILSVQNLTVYRPKGDPIVKDVNLEIDRGEVVGIIGESGAGKSTLIKAILNELDLPFKGTIHLSGVDVVKHRSTVANVFGYVPQDLSRVYQHMTAMENMFVFGRSYGLASGEIRKRAIHLFDILDIKDAQRNTLPVSKLSGGEQRRISMAVGMIHNPDLLIMDEPTSGLDPAMRSIIWTYIDKLNRQYKTTIIVVTHFPEEAEFCDKVALFMKPQGFISYGSPRDLIQQLPNEGYVVDIVLESFDDTILSALKKMDGVKYILLRGERIRIFAETPTNVTTINAVQLLTMYNIGIHKIEPKKEATLTDYFNIIAGEHI